MHDGPLLHVLERRMSAPGADNLCMCVCVRVLWCSACALCPSSLHPDARPLPASGEEPGSEGTAVTRGRERQCVKVEEDFRESPESRIKCIPPYAIHIYAMLCDIYRTEL